MTSEPIRTFHGFYGFLSNFWQWSLRDSQYPHIEYPTAEHYYQASKSDDPVVREMISVLASPGQAKRAGQPLRPKGWELRSEDVMRHVLLVKFEDLFPRKLLLKTIGRELIEGNTWHDNHWGDCQCPKCGDIPGQNTLGRLLMQVRKHYEGTIETRHPWDKGSHLRRC